MPKQVSYETFKKDFLTIDALAAADLTRFSTTAVEMPLSGSFGRLDPLSEAYKQQVLAEHQLITGRQTPYDPVTNEKAAAAHFLEDASAGNVHP